MIEARSLHKKFRNFIAVDHVSFEAHDGAVTGLLGPNGAGKTTTLRMLYGLIRPDRGRIVIDGLDMESQPMEARACLGVLPDSHGLYPRLTAREHIHYFGSLHGMTSETLEQKAQELIDSLDMNSIADRRSSGFSQGERMKVNLARTLVHNPSTIILDEPSNGLDVMAARNVREMIKSLRDAGKCVLFSSHVMQEISTLCDTIVIMAQGNIVAQGDVQALCKAADCSDIEEAFVRLSSDSRSETST